MDGGLNIRFLDMPGHGGSPAHTLAIAALGDEVRVGGEVQVVDLGLRSIFRM
jgi:hypothetical protein